MTELFENMLRAAHARVPDHDLTVITGHVADEIEAGDRQRGSRAGRILRKDFEVSVAQALTDLGLEWHGLEWHPMTKFLRHGNP